MPDIAWGLLAVVVGAYFCFRGHVVLRFVIPLWGAFVGFNVGAGLVAGLGDQSFLGTALGWVVAFLFAVVFAILAYAYYAVGIIIAMGAIGFAIGTALVVAFGISWSWLIILAGVAVGVLLAIAAILSDLPMLVLIVLSSIAGASAVVAGLMLLTGATDVSVFSDATAVARVHDDWWWYALLLVLAVAGVVAQSRDVAAMRQSVRQGWPAASR
ncbi:MAG: TMEM198/TM7SF3 family protein [Micrococcales bacterium]|nr:TMEM198/TM7SF3 family protein [Micrococcales bacterium]